MHPTHRISPGRTKRRRNHLSLKPRKPTMCPVSGMPKQHHRACTESGYVRPGLVVSVPKLGIGPDRD